MYIFILPIPFIIVFTHMSRIIMIIIIFIIILLLTSTFDIFEFYYRSFW